MLFLKPIYFFCPEDWIRALYVSFRFNVMYAQVSGIGSNVKSKQFWYFLTIFVIVYLLDNKSLRIQIYICDVFFFHFCLILYNWTLICAKSYCVTFSPLFPVFMFILFMSVSFVLLFNVHNPFFSIVNFSLWYTYLFICKSTPNLLCVWCGHLKQRFIQLSMISFPVLWIFTLWRNKKLSLVIMMWQFK